MTFSTNGVFDGRKTTGYVCDDAKDLDTIIDQAADPDVRVAMINLALPPVSHVFLIMKLDHELRVYDVQNHYAASGLVLTHYDDVANENLFDSNGYRYFVNGLLAKLHMKRDQLCLMPSPELSLECWEVIDHCAETGEPLHGDTRGACLLWCDAVLNRYWRQLLDEAYS